MCQCNIFTGPSWWPELYYENLYLCLPIPVPEGSYSVFSYSLTCVNNVARVRGKAQSFFSKIR